MVGVGSVPLCCCFVVLGVVQCCGVVAFVLFLFSGVCSVVVVCVCLCVCGCVCLICLCLLCCVWCLDLCVLLC